MTERPRTGLVSVDTEAGRIWHDMWHPPEHWFAEEPCDWIRAISDIEDEARAQLQALDDQRALRRSGVKSVHDIGDDDWDEEDVDDEDGPEIIYVRD